MRKIFALFTNEMIKTTRKASVIVLLSLIVVGIFGVGGIFKYMSSTNNQNNNSSYNQYLTHKNSEKEDLALRKTNLADLKNKRENAKADEILILDQKIADEQKQVDMLSYAKKLDIVLNSDSYRAQSIQSLYNYKDSERMLKQLPATMLTDDQKSVLKTIPYYIENFQNVIDNKDFKAFISLRNKEINENKSLSKNEKKISLESNQLRLIQVKECQTLIEVIIK